MPDIKPYTAMSVELMAATPYPATIVALALSIVMRSQSDAELPVFTEEVAGFIIDAEHTSVFEHVVFTFLIQNVSRSFLAQITRQRTASPTSGSQHYQNYSSYPCMLREFTPDEDSELEPSAKAIYEDCLMYYYDAYKRLIELGEPKEEARQVLPNAASVNYLWTIDARNLMFFLRQRLCYRNVKEMETFAHRVLEIAREHFPELFNCVGPQCLRGKCYQGRMRCNRGPWKRP